MGLASLASGRPNSSPHYLRGGHQEHRDRLFIGGETLEQVAQRSCRCPIAGSVQSQVRRGFEQPDLGKDVLAHGTSVAVFPKAQRERAKSREKDGEGSALRPDISQKPCVAWTRSCWTPHPVEIQILVPLIHSVQQAAQAKRA
ncbi:hypothetical protein QYF61_014307 [Mycteria americana]|uniref:Uncharacterized protein n=1 Tax=Mycteria americana TaxID=33587 RepID=A0AAN7NUY2_MYCAM|nr:hypothetical protein QYF61_014307 [Mycteria americana]